VCGVLGSELDRVLDVVRVEEHVAQQIAHPVLFGTDELTQDREIDLAERVDAAVPPLVDALGVFAQPPRSR